MNQYKDRKGEEILTGDYLLNPHTDDVVQVDTRRKKLWYPDGSSVAIDRAGTGDWWVKITPEEYDQRSIENDRRDSELVDLKRLTKKLTGG